LKSSITGIDALEQLGVEGVTLVTPNERQAATLKRQFNAAQVAQGRATWVSPDILPISRFVERIFTALTHRIPESFQRQLISSDLTLMLWEQVIRQSEPTDALALLSIRETAKNAAAAYRLAHQWQLFSALENYPSVEDSRTWLVWEKRFSEQLKAKKLITAATLPDYLRAVLNRLEDKSPLLPKVLMTAGFDIVTPQQQQFFDAMMAYGVEVNPLSTTMASANNVSRVVFATEEDELRAAAAWARDKLAVEHQQNIAIVVPDLRGKRSQIKRILTDALAPSARSNGALAPTHFNISLGEPLSHYALVFDALNLLAFSLNKPIPILDFSRLLRSPFIAGAGVNAEMASRAKLDAAFRDIAHHEVSLFSVQRQFKLSTDKRLINAVESCGIFVSLIDRVAQLKALPVSASPHDWRQYFSHALAAWGFAKSRHADALDSTQYQVLAKFRESLTTLASHQTINNKLRGSEALMLLSRLAADTIFQPETNRTAEPAIQVLGILESAGHSTGAFDALWVTGLTESAWPLAATPNPFIPVGLQRSVGIPESAAQHSLALDRKITQGWCASAAEVVFSHAELTSSGGADDVRRASALITHVALTDTPVIEKNMAEAMQLSALTNANALEVIPDAALSPFAAPTRVHGGATMLADQAACPFRAFARHRLSAKPLATPTLGIDAANRGNLLHDVLHRVWSKLKTLDYLQSLSLTAREAVVQQSVDSAITDAHQAGLAILTGRFAVIESTRLRHLVLNWLDYELTRAPFTVVGVEASRVATLANINMKLRLDRIDKLSDGTHALIDYKTGEAKIKSWLGPRPDEPQLPLYYHAVEACGDSVSTLAFARVKRGLTFGFEGVSAAPDMLPNVTMIEDKRGGITQDYQSWDVLVQSWEESLNTLAGEFANGVNTVTPKNGALTCARCDLQSICRISAMALPINEAHDE
jgi:ATP-dependent helicase/nuclease subunit B